MGSQQKITFPDNGSRAMRVLDALTPVNKVVAPAINAQYLGQIYVDSDAKTAYIAIAVDSVDPADDWKQVTFVTE